MCSRITKAARVRGGRDPSVHYNFNVSTVVLLIFGYHVDRPPPDLVFVAFDSNNVALDPSRDR